MRFKEIKLLPTEWSLDVWIRSSREKVGKQFSKRYGETADYYNKKDREIPYLDYVCALGSTKKSELKGHTRIVLVMGKLDLGVVVHEIIHVLWRMNHHIGLEFKDESQEWQACMAEYIFNEIKKNDWLWIK